MTDPVEVAKRIARSLTPPIGKLATGGYIPTGYVDPSDPQRADNLQKFQAGNHPDIPSVVYHGGGEDINEFNTQGNSGKTAGTGAFFSDAPPVSNTYAAGRGPNLMPVHLSMKNPVVVDAKGRNWDKIHHSSIMQIPQVTKPDQDEDLLSQLYDKPSKKSMIVSKARKSNVGKEFGMDDEGHVSTDDLARWARQNGHEGLIVKNVVDHGPSGRYSTMDAFKPRSLFVAFKPNQIKSAIGNNGQFDPNKNEIYKAGGGYVTGQDGPFYRVQSKSAPEGSAGAFGVGSTLERQGGAGETQPTGMGQERFGLPKRPSDDEIKSIINDPSRNRPLRFAQQYTQRNFNRPLVPPDMPASSLRKQSAIARAHMLAVEGSPEYKQAIFNAYQQHMPDVVRGSGAKDYDDLLKKSYAQMVHETGKQFREMPMNYSYHQNGEGNYPTSRDMAADVHANNHLYTFQGGDPHDFLHHVDPETGLNENEKFRAVHDLFGHATMGNSFGPQGEETAWGLHSQMYSPLARPAMTSETRGQNSVVNYSPLNADLKEEVANLDSMISKARKAKDFAAEKFAIAAKKKAFEGFQFAPQKAVLLPPEFLRTDYAGGMPEYLQHLIKPEAGTTSSADLTHFSHEPNLSEIDPTKYGTGIKGAERSRIINSKGEGHAGAVRDRAYFYTQSHEKAPEAGLGQNRYGARDENLYDMQKDPAKLRKLAVEANRQPHLSNFNPGLVDQGRAQNDMERMAKEYGYSGVMNNAVHPPMAAMFNKTPVKQYADGGSVKK